MNPRKRLDAELVRRKIAASRTQATQLIASGVVTVSGSIATNASRQVAASEPIELVGPRPRFVGRGGEKLVAALENFSIDVTGKTALDVGASTGGFTDCLLQSGATRVVALDVGHGQIHERLRANPRVEVLERTNIRHVMPQDLADAPFAVISIDVSFISLKTIASAVIGLAANPADIVALIKPQFEAGRSEVSKGRGVVKGELVWREVLQSTLGTMHGHGAATMGVMVSPLVGADGNVEFLGWFRTGVDATSIDVEQSINHVVEQAEIIVQGERDEKGDGN